MPSINENLSAWDRNYEWSEAGDEWSQPWGDSSMQWYASLLPRIHSFLPADTILEIAPGFGRWTRFLKNYCNNLILVDLSQKCIDACQKRFENEKHISYHVNDGSSLEFIPDSSLDFVFSFDSLVHADHNIMKQYIAQLAKKLKPTGVAFIHHSNLKPYAGYFSATSRIPKNIKRFLEAKGIIDTYGWRDKSVDAGVIKAALDENNLFCLSQEKMNWFATRRLTDCMTIFTRKQGMPETVILENKDFRNEVKYIFRLSKLYGSSRFTQK